MKVSIIQSPLVQLNSPYPSGAYLSSFFRREGLVTEWKDFSIELFYSIFSKEGLKKLFDLSEEHALELASEAERKGDDFTAFNLRRYVSTSEYWINWIDFITGILCSGRKDFSGRELTHKFLYSPFSPRGNRMDSFLSNLNHEPSADDVRFLCSYALEDLSDYITVAFDPDFSLIRYAEALTVDESSFSQIEKRIDSPVLETFYKPVLEKYLNKIMNEDVLNKESDFPERLICISIPFAGTFVPSLYAARFFKKSLGNSVFIVFGGGFVNTELRQASDKALFNYIDGISYDRGYGSYKELLATGFDKTILATKQLYKFRYFSKAFVTEPVWQNKDSEEYEEKLTSVITPDYTDIDFGIYPRVCDDTNPMHRLWTDGAWIKAYLAHGCYWHKCAFCDVQLDYVCGYKKTDSKNLYKSLLETAREKGVYGIHFVDEALPPTSIVDFALENARQGSPLYFWGNVRFEKTFTRDTADFLSYCGFGGVSAGIEAATGKGLENINKGTDIESIVSACAAFKEAGILVHAYMIYGFWNDTPQDIINSMETLRQFFEVGLLDSAFWHKFVLTRNSRIYGEWEKGLHKELKPIENKEKGIFAKNNLHFEGENKYSKFGRGLDSAVNSWMHGDKLEMKVTKWFDFSVPEPTIQKNFVNGLVEKYERKKASAVAQKISVEQLNKMYWLGSKPFITSLNGSKKINWMYLQEEFNLPVGSSGKGKEISQILNKLSPSASQECRNEVITQLTENTDIIKILQNFRGNGLVLL